MRSGGALASVLAAEIEVELVRGSLANVAQIMPCPFPGMDPYLEMQPFWSDFLA
jgi:hypothetical protein